MKWTHTDAPETPPITVESLAGLVDAVKMQYPFAGMGMVSMKWMPEGHFAMVGHNSMAIGLPDGRVLAFKRRDQLSPWKLQT